MKSIPFEDTNTEVAKDQNEYVTLPALRINDQYGTMITKWHIPFWKRVLLLFTGTIWMSEMTFGKPVTPRRFAYKRKDVYLKEGESQTVNTKTR